MEPNLDVQLMEIAQWQSSEFPVTSDIEAECSKALTRADVLIGALHYYWQHNPPVGTTEGQSDEIRRIEVLLTEWHGRYQPTSPQEAIKHD
jgi:hypothetical protein